MSLIGDIINRADCWRDGSGRIRCPGGMCQNQCDETCPVYLNTQALMTMKTGGFMVAIFELEEAVKIAPDYYDAWNNLGEAYGHVFKFSSAYTSYKKAYELNSQKPNPVYELMKLSYTLGKYEECIEWCDIYKKLSRDMRDIPIRYKAKKELRR